ncbi:MAG: hypothetical protein POELPBGB_00398 [Bacteroidia bacterium]|nr:hypothetical protein [Bacteroidia bacterium]
MRKTITLLFTIILGLNYFVAAQNTPPGTCGTDRIHKYMMQTNDEYREKYLTMDHHIQTIQQNGNTLRSENTVYIIPLVIHIIHLGEAVGTGSNISDAQVYDAIEGINDRFRNDIGNSLDTEIEFCLANIDPSGNPTTGINRVNGSGVQGYTTNGINMANCSGGGADEQSIKSLSAWPVDEYYNIWVVHSICNGQWAGYAYYPWGDWTDGAIIDADEMIYNSSTPAHELGHGFNLMHTFEGDDDDNQCPVNNNCITDGDKVCDTPPHKQSDCGTSCAGSNSWNASKYNYMSYSRSYCSLILDRFTPGQKERMVAALSISPRVELTTSQKCGSAPFANFSATPTSGNPGTAVQFTDQSVNNPTQWLWNFGDGSTSTVQNPSHTYTNVGNYTVTLTASNTNGNDTETKYAYIYIGVSGIGNCDTIWMPSADPNDTWVTYGGFSMGNNSYGDVAKAQVYTPANATSHISEVLVNIGELKKQSGNPNSSITLTIYDIDGSGYSTMGWGTGPGTILATTSYPVSQLSINNPNIFSFSSPVAVSSTYAVGIDFSNMVAGDSIALISTSDGDADGAELAWDKTSSGDWVSILFRWSLDIDLSIIPIECDQTTVGIEPSKSGNLFSIFPNPTTGIITINNEFVSDYYLQLHNTLGQLVFEKQATENTTQVGLQNYPAGVYTITITEGDNPIRTKIVKQ